MVHFEFVISGFGGQGILSMGRMLAHAGMIEGMNVSWLPSYGPEMRGGTANCNVVLSSNSIGSPIINKANGLIAMNGPSFDKFEEFLVPGGFVIVDSSLVERTPLRKDIEYIEIPATQLANDAGNTTYAGIILLGKLISNIGLISVDTFEKALENVLPVKKHYMIPEEIEMLKLGMTYQLL